MTIEQAKEKAQEKVYINMNIQNIEDECKRLGIKIVKNRMTMEQKLIKKYIEEWSVENDRN